MLLLCEEDCIKPKLIVRESKRNQAQEVVYVDEGDRGCVKINSNSGGRSGIPVTL